MKIKVCGMRAAANIQAVAALPIDYMGFIFYTASPRYTSHFPKIDFPNKIKKVGVFVNASPAVIAHYQITFGLDIAQLHGQERPTYCANIQALGLEVWKAFSVDAQFDFQQLDAYQACCSRFVLDAKGKAPGGNGHTFDWDSLEEYQLEQPFFLSGGIGMEQVERLKTWSHPACVGLDVNSRFEIAPAQKDVEQLATFIQQVSQ